MIPGDTIVAISSAVGPAARMIVRASGPEAPRLASAHCGDALPAPSSAARVTFRFAELSVPGWLYVFLAPRSYTGEDLVEFHVPGNPLLARLLLDALVAAGARPADPGEFTARAYFNGRLDLTEAEGVAATIAAGSEQELRAARQLMAGELARRLRPASDLIAETLALVEVGIDFSEEDVTFLSAGEVASRCARADADLRELLEQSTRFERLTHEPAVVLAGRPNAGKSTLLNALAGHERAVTSPVAGTTRDVLTAAVALPRGIVRLIDAAGVEADVSAPNGIAAGGIVSEEIVSDGIAFDGTASDGTASDGIVSARIAADMRRHALRAVETADALVLVRDATDDRPDIDLPRRPDLVVRSKADLLTRGGGGGAGQAPDAPLSVSAKTGHNLDALREALDRLAFGDAHAGGASLALNARHVRAVSEARAALARAAEHMPGGAAELAALELREALDALGSVVGVVSPDDVLGRVFSAFCIGK